MLKTTVQYTVLYIQAAAEWIRDLISEVCSRINECTERGKVCTCKMRTHRSEGLSYPHTTNSVIMVGIVCGMTLLDRVSSSGMFDISAVRCSRGFLHAVDALW